MRLKIFLIIACFCNIPYTESIAKEQLLSSSLEQCWTLEQLQGSIGDKEVIRPIPNDSQRIMPTLPKSSDVPIPTVSSHLKSHLGKSIRRVIPRDNEKLVALTFDLCERELERTGYDAEIVNYLREHKIKATFYAGGKWMQSHPDKAKQLMADPLFEIGNHAWTHGNLRVLKGQEISEQVDLTQVQYLKLRESLQQRCPVERIASVPFTFRFPYGTCSKESLQALADRNLLAIQWDVVTGDPTPKQSAEAIASTVLKKTQPGSIIIAHANGRGWHTAKALNLFVPKLKEKGYEFVTISELLSQAEYIESVDECYEQKPNDNQRYDKIFGDGRR